MLRFCLEKGVSDAKGVEGTQLKQSLTILIHFPTPNYGPRQEDHELLSAPTLALKSPRRTIAPSQGWSRLLMQDPRRTHLLRQEWRAILGGTH